VLIGTTFSGFHPVVPARLACLEELNLSGHFNPLPKKNDHFNDDFKGKHYTPNYNYQL
jgi:hypothetical protein